MAGNRKRERRFTKRMQIKLLAVFAFVLLALVVVLVRLAYINLKSGKRYAKQVLSQKNYDSQTLYSRRGEIQDTNGQILAYSEKVYNLVLDCYAVNQDEDYLEPTVNVLSEVFGLSKSELTEILTDEATMDSQYQVLLKNVTEEQKEEYEAYVSTDESRELTSEERQELSLVTGVWFEEDFIRQYPYDSLASTVLGFADEYGDGIVGLEAYYDEQLKGTNGRVFGYLNSDQEYMKKTIAPENGYTLQTTLDVNVQRIVEKYIAEFDEEYGDETDDGTAKHGAKDVGVIVMDPNTGGIIAMATNSSYNLNDPKNLDDWYTVSEQNSMTNEEYAEALSGIWSNYCISDGIEPGSTFKPITMSAALESGVVTENSYFVCDGGEFITDTTIHCDAYPGAHGDEALKDVLVNSCNDGMMQIAAKMGVSSFIDYQSLFNFGKITGIDLPNEASGAVYSKTTMNEVELATCSFGQGLTCTMIQEIAAFCSVVNGGYYYQPHVVDKILDEDGGVVKDTSNLLLKQTISSDVSEIMRDYLEAVVEEGTGKTARVPGYRVGGKTGTAEKIDYTTGQRADGKYLVSFIGAIPINDPQVVLYVVVDEPNVDNQANSRYAQTLFRNIALEMLPYLGIYQTEEISDTLLAELGMTRKDLESTGNSSGAVITFQALDSYGNVYNDARVTDGKVTDADGNELAGSYIDESGNVYDGLGNLVSTVTVEETEAKVDNPDMAVPPDENTGEGENTTTWDATTTDDDIEENE